MEILMILIYIIFSIITLFLSFTTINYFITMWKFKNRKEDGSEDDKFKRFD